MKLKVLLAHPALERSCVNRLMAEAIRDEPDIDLVDLYQCYPDGMINVDREQTRLQSMDLLVLQHPFYWYSAPALLKEWLDLVLAYGFAYGDGADALSGKYVMSAISAGAPEAAYCESGYNQQSVETLLTPFEQTFHYCEMHWLRPLLKFEAISGISEAEASIHAQAYRRWLCGLRDGAVDLGALQGTQPINGPEEVDQLLGQPA